MKKYALTLIQYRKEKDFVWTLPYSFPSKYAAKKHAQKAIERGEYDDYEITDFCENSECMTT